MVPADYFALMCFAFACIAGFMGEAPVKAGLAAIIGLSLSCVGLDSNSGVYRFTGDNIHLSDGIQFVVVVIGVFSISEILLMLQARHSTDGLGRKLFNLQEMAYTGWATLRSSVVGFVMGALALYKITPGPALLTQQPDLMWGLIASLFTANVLLLVINIPMVGVFIQVLRCPIGCWPPASWPSARSACTPCMPPPLTCC